MSDMTAALAAYASMIVASYPQARADALQAYVQKKDNTPLNATLAKTPSGLVEIDFKSQTWQGIVWKHKILVSLPEKGATPNGLDPQTAILFITGDGPRNGDYLDLALLAKATGMPIAMLFNIPNQPIWDMKEDDLIAHTFQKYLETGDESWPLLFPMTKSAVRAMDCLGSMAQDLGILLNRFVVTGASKRGWTTWLTAASGDKRVVGIAPMVYDNLNLNAQMPGQIANWGEYSEQIADYTRRGLQAKLATPEGKRLSQMVDPYTYRAGIKVPTLIVNGANDAYWVADAHNRYWNDLRQPKWILQVPNSGHGLEDRNRVVASVGAFARSLAGEFPMPTVGGAWTFEQDGSRLNYRIQWDGIPFDQITVWRAQTTNRMDFRKSKWERVQTLPTATTVSLELEREVSEAYMIEFRVRSFGRIFTVTSTVCQVPKKETGRR
jgi:PhoPQ-activated pathogenicity-related protein